VDLDDVTLGSRADGETKCTLYTRLSTIIAQKTPYGYTATHDGLQRAHDVLLNSRPHAKKAVLVVTDGKSNIGPPPIRVAGEIVAMKWNHTWNAELLGPQVRLTAHLVFLLCIIMFISLTSFRERSESIYGLFIANQARLHRRFLGEENHVRYGDWKM